MALRWADIGDMANAPFAGGRFRNAHPTPDRPGGVLRWMLTRRKAKWPDFVANTPFPPPSRVATGRIAVTFIGHATFLIQVGGVVVLTDPIWSARASPVSWAGPRRVREPGQPLEALPPANVLLVSHCHYDHLDLPTLRRVQAMWAPETVTGLGNARHLAKAGIVGAHELDWWETVSVAGATITYIPAQHFSARTPFDRDRTLWGGFVIEAGGTTVYFAGDTGYGPHFREIRRQFPRIDLALLPIGAYEPRWFMSGHHMNPDDAVRAHLDLGGPPSIGMHHATIQLTDEAIDAPAEALAVARAAHGVAAERFGVLAVGETAVIERQAD
jgi:L-ascorbate metabolism protein UlaG (beta-lactamase superfamily)